MMGEAANGFEVAIEPDYDREPPILRDIEEEYPRLQLFVQHRLRRTPELATALEASRLLSFEFVPQRGTCVVRWCLSEASTRDLRRLDLNRDGSDMESRLLASFDEPAALAVAQAPSAIIAVGEVPSALLPAPVSIPRGWDDVSAVVAEAITALLDELARHDQLRRALDAAVLATDHEAALEALAGIHGLLLETASRVRWVEPRGEDAVGLRRDVARAGELLRQTCMDALPPFLAERYWVEFTTGIDSRALGRPFTHAGVAPRNGGAGRLGQRRHRRPQRGHLPRRARLGVRISAVHDNGRHRRPRRPHARHREPRGRRSGRRAASGERARPARR